MNWQDILAQSLVAVSLVVVGLRCYRAIFQGPAAGSCGSCGSCASKRGHVSATLLEIGPPLRGR